MRWRIPLEIPGGLRYTERPMSQANDQAAVTPRAQDYAQWYLDVIKRGDLAEHSAEIGRAHV